MPPIFEVVSLKAKVFRIVDEVLKGDFMTLDKGTRVEGEYTSTRRAITLVKFPPVEGERLPYGMSMEDLKEIPVEQPLPDGDEIIWEPGTLVLVAKVTGEVLGENVERVTFKKVVG